MNELQEAARALLVALEVKHYGRTIREMCNVEDESVALFDALCENDDEEVEIYMDHIVTEMHRSRTAYGLETSYADAYDLDLSRQREALKGVAA